MKTYKQFQTESGDFARQMAHASAVGLYSSSSRAEAQKKAREWKIGKGGAHQYKGVHKHEHGRWYPGEDHKTVAKHIKKKWGVDHV